MRGSIVPEAYRPKHARPSDWIPAIGLGAGLLLAVAVVVALVVLGGSGERTTVMRPGSPEAPVVPPWALSAAQPEPPPGPREPTVGEAAEFAASYQPPGATAKRMVAANANVDGGREIVFVSIIDGASRMEVAAWDGREYQIVGRGRGGPATEIVDLAVRDATRDRVREIIVTQRNGQSRSVSIWGWDGARYAPQVAVGGCADGRNTFGVNGAQVGVGTIIATCDASPEGPRSVYIWNSRAKAWVYDKTGA